MGGDGSQRFIANRIDAVDESGASVGNAGEIDGDGIDDLVVGASDASPNAQFGAGETYVIFGRAAGTQRVR